MVSLVNDALKEWSDTSSNNVSYCIRKTTPSGEISLGHPQTLNTKEILVNASSESMNSSMASSFDDTVPSIARHFDIQMLSSLKKTDKVFDD